MEHTESTMGVESDSAQYLTFMLDKEEYGLDILRVQEIKGWERPTPVPNAPSYMQGVVNLRGTIVPIIDLRMRFGLSHVEPSRTSVVIVVKAVSQERERAMGIAVDAVSDVYNIPSKNIEPPPDLGAAGEVDFAQGIATVSEKIVILLDIDALLSSDELSAIDSVSHR